MKYLILLLSISSISLCLQAQNAKEQDLYNKTIKDVVFVSNTESRFIDDKGRIIGYRKITLNDTLYLDRLKRTIHTSKITREGQQTTSRDSLSAPINGDLGPALDNRLNQVHNTPETSIVRRRNRITYFNANGEKELIVRRRRSGKKVTYRDGKRKLLGYKRIENNGVSVYYDNKRRKTGQSFISANGRLIFEPIRNRVTPSFMLKEIFLSY